MRDFKDPYYAGPDCVCCRSAAQERERIRAWVEAHRSRTELADDVYLTRDHFNSDDLLEFLDGDAGA